MEIRLKDEISYDDRVILKGFLTEGDEEWSTEDRVEVIREVLSQGSNFIEFINSRGQYRVLYDRNGVSELRTSGKESDIRGGNKNLLFGMYVKDFDSLLNIESDRVKIGDFGISTLETLSDMDIMIESDYDELGRLEDAVGIELDKDIKGNSSLYKKLCFDELYNMGVRNLSSCYMLRDCDGYWCVFNGLQFLFKVHDSNSVFFPYIKYLERMLAVCGVRVGAVDFSFSGRVAYIASVRGMKYFLRRKVKNFKMTTNIKNVWDRKEEFQLGLAMKGINFCNRLVNKYSEGKVYFDYFELNVDCCEFTSKNNYLVIDY